MRALTAWPTYVALALAGAMLAGPAAAVSPEKVENPPGAAQAPVTVIELFTSQGCSSCPQADALLKTLAERPDTVALTFPVDYWDYLGWKDTLASPKFSARQRAYATARGDGLGAASVVVPGTNNPQTAPSGAEPPPHHPPTLECSNRSVSTSTPALTYREDVGTREPRHSRRAPTRRQRR